jgi:hypothetical protein
MPEMAWNATCSNPILLNVYTSYTNVEALCNAAENSTTVSTWSLVEVASGGGGVSNCTTNNSTPTSTTWFPGSCSGGYAKPSWQTGVAGIPADGKRDLPDISLFGSYGFGQGDNTGIPGSTLLICMSSATTPCNYSTPGYIVYQENGGTSAASPMAAGIMALVVQKAGTKQGLANPVFYSLAAKENYAACNSNTVAAGNACIFYDTTTGTNAMNCTTGDTNCVTSVTGDATGILSGYNATTSYDLTTGLGSMNVANLVNAWPTTAAAPAVTLAPTSLTFASTTVGVTTAAQLVTVTNSGTAALTLTSETLTGTNATSFLISANTCTTSLAAEASCTVSVEFKPAAAGALAASLSIADNATGSPQAVALTGTGAAAAAPILTLSPASIAFPATVTASTSAAQVVTVSNTGTAAATISSIALSGTNSTSFVEIGTCGTSLAAGSSCSIVVAFKPASAAALSGTLTVTDNAAGSPQSVALTGTGTAAPTLTLSAASMAFPTTLHATTSTALAVTLTNSGTETITLNSISLAGTSPADFTELNTCGATLAPAANCVVYVAFKPAAAAAYTATLSIADNGAASPQSVALTGTGN